MNFTLKNRNVTREMLSLRWRHVVLLTFLQYSNCQRRIVDGYEVTTPKPYMVYLISASIPPLYDAWTCGGAIVTEWYVLTAAACLEDINKAYVIAGYKHYKNVLEISQDKCIMKTRRKIVSTYTPLTYEFEYEGLDSWANLDITLVKVDKPYNVADKTFKKVCSYTPGLIAINYDLENEVPGTNVIVLGWGHTHKWRTAGDDKDYNAKTLRYASTKILDKGECKKSRPDLSEIIENYMICSTGEGEIDEKGIITQNVPSRRISNLSMDASLKESFGQATEKIEIIDVDSVNLTIRSAVTRRQGICQNDHGGPLVSWIDGQETVLGVASVFKVNENNECVAPFLYTSTAQTVEFLKCVLHINHTISRRSTCNQPRDSMRRFKILRRDLSKIKKVEIGSDEVDTRPQISIN